MTRAEPDRVGAGEGAADGPRITIRAMRPDDLSAVMSIERLAFSSPWTLSTFVGLLRRDNTRLWVAESAGAVIGYAVVWMVADQAELGNLAVAPTWRRQGLGRRLLEVVLDAMRVSGIRELFLEVRASNAAAQRLYDRYGFERVGRRAGYYTHPKEDALVLRRVIEPGSEGPG